MTTHRRRAFDSSSLSESTLRSLLKPGSSDVGSAKSIAFAGFEACILQGVDGLRERSALRNEKCLVVGERFVKGKPFEGPRASVNIAQLGADDDAREALDYARKEALKPPCFASCSVDAREFGVPGIPGAKGVQLKPQRHPPPNTPPPFESYAVGFTLGPRLYLVHADGEPGQPKKSQVVSAAKALYERNAKSDEGE